MIVWFVAAQLLTALAVRWLFSERRRAWTRRETLLSTLVPVGLFIVWALFWYEFTVDLLPERWFDRPPTAGSLAFMCIPPFLVSWIVFFGFSKSFRRGNPMA
jgi:hypothetical protein